MKRKWLINTCRRLPFAVPATGTRAELVSYYGKFVSMESTTPGASWEEVRVQFWATRRGGVARMLNVLGLGQLTASEVIHQMEKVQP